MKATRAHAQLLQEIIDAVPTDERSPYHYFLFRGKMDFDALYVDQHRRKEWLAVRLKQFARDEANAYDVATTWSPMNGLSVVGVVFPFHPSSYIGNTQEERLQVEQVDSTYVKWRHLPGYDGADNCWMGVPDARKKQGKLILARLEALKEEVAGPSEVNDFFASYFGLFRAMGSTVIDGNRTALVPARFSHLELGLFMRLPKDRLYEVPNEWELVPQTAFVFAQEIETALKVPTDATIQEA